MSNNTEDGSPAPVANDDRERPETFKKTLSLNKGGREWYLEGRDHQPPEHGTVTVDLVEIVMGEVCCKEATAKHLLAKGVVRILDHHDIPKWVGTHVTPGGYGIAY